MIEMQMFDIWTLLVEYVFGSFLSTIVGLAVIFFIIGVLGKMSPKTIMLLLVLFFMTVGVGWLGALVAIPLFIACFTYFVKSALNLYWART